MKTGADALGSAENKSGRANMKTGPEALGNAENSSESGKHENGIGRPRYHRKRVRARKT
jgi:hypothetical protein